MSSEVILIVDDDPDIVDYLGSFLEDEGYEVATAMSSDGAFQLLPKVKPDIVLIDVMMPVRSGLDLLVSMRRDELWKDTKIIMITGSDQVLDDDCRSYMSSFEGIRGPDRVLGKPVDRETLLSELRDLRPLN